MGKREKNGQKNRAEGVQGQQGEEKVGLSKDIWDEWQLLKGRGGGHDSQLVLEVRQEWLLDTRGTGTSTAIRYLLFSPT